MTRTDDVVMERLRSADPLPHDDLDRLLRETAMPDLSASPAGRRAPARRGRRVLWGAATAVAVIGVAGVLVVSLPHGEERAATPGHIGILDRPATDADRLPEWVRGEQLILEQGIDPKRARLAQETQTRRYYIAPADGARVCLVDVPVRRPPMPAPGPGWGGGPGLKTGGIQCADNQVFMRRFMIVLVGYGPGGRQLQLAGVVPDGYDRASLGSTSVEVKNNLFVMEPSKLSADGVSLSGPAGTRTAYHWFVLGWPSPRIPTGLDLTVSVLRRPASQADTPPPALSAALEAARRRPGGPDPEPGGERLVTTAGRTGYWLIRDRYRGSRRALLAMVSGTSVTLRPIVLPTPAQPFRAFPSTAIREPYGPTRITLRTIVPDGFTTAVIGERTFPVTNNFLLVRGLSVTGRYRVDLTGPAGTVTQFASLGSNAFRDNIPTNIVSPRVQELAALRAARAGLRAPYSATIVAGLRKDAADVLGPWAETPPANGYQRTVTVVVVRSVNDALVVVIESAAGPDPVFKERRYRVDQVPDLSVLGRVRPLNLD